MDAYIRAILDDHDLLRILVTCRDLPELKAKLTEYRFSLTDEQILELKNSFMHGENAMHSNLLSIEQLDMVSGGLKVKRNTRNSNLSVKEKGIVDKYPRTTTFTAVEEGFLQQEERIALAKQFNIKFDRGKFGLESNAPLSSLFESEKIDVEKELIDIYNIVKRDEDAKSLDIDSLARISANIYANKNGDFADFHFFSKERNGVDSNADAVRDVLADSLLQNPGLKSSPILSSVIKASECRHLENLFVYYPDSRRITANLFSTSALISLVKVLQEKKDNVEISSSEPRESEKFDDSYIATTVKTFIMDHTLLLKLAKIESVNGKNDKEKAKLMLDLVNENPPSLADVALNTALMPNTDATQNSSLMPNTDATQAPAPTPNTNITPVSYGTFMHSTIFAATHDHNNDTEVVPASMPELPTEQSKLTKTNPSTSAKYMSAFLIDSFVTGACFICASLISPVFLAVGVIAAIFMPYLAFKTPQHEDTQPTPPKNAQPTPPKNAQPTPRKNAQTTPRKNAQSPPPKDAQTTPPKNAQTTTHDSRHRDGSSKSIAKVSTYDQIQQIKTNDCSEIKSLNLPSCPFNTECFITDKDRHWFSCYRFSLARNSDIAINEIHTLLETHSEFFKARFQENNYNKFIDDCNEQNNKTEILYHVISLLCPFISFVNRDYLDALNSCGEVSEESGEWTAKRANVNSTKEMAQKISYLKSITTEQLEDAINEAEDFYNWLNGESVQKMSAPPREDQKGYNRKKLENFYSQNFRNMNNGVTLVTNCIHMQDMRVDAIVNASNACGNVGPGWLGTAGAIGKKSGADANTMNAASAGAIRTIYGVEDKNSETLLPGQVIVTPTAGYGEDEAKYVFHALSPVNNGGLSQLTGLPQDLNISANFCTTDFISNAMYISLVNAHKMEKVNSIAIPLIGTGVFGNSTYIVAMSTLVALYRFRQNFPDSTLKVFLLYGGSANPSPYENVGLRTQTVVK